jgi:CDP-paratose 2-epimerase
MKVLITGAGGLIGSEAAKYYGRQGDEVHGLDNNMRELFFGPRGNVRWNIQRLVADIPSFRHIDLDIRNRDGVTDLFRAHRFDRVIHCAAQPSHDKAKEIPYLDFEVNAVGTLNLLESARQHCPECVFIHMSTNKVYGDAPNEIPLTELEARWDYARPADHNGVDETCRIDRTTHSLFGASKTAADIMAQEYGRYFDMNVGIFRGGCLTGPSHSGVELHGFLSYLVKVAVAGEPYTIFGYKGKQVRDNIHSYDVIQAFEAFARNPRSGEVYNLGGGRQNSVSVLEAIAAIDSLTGRKLAFTYDERNRLGDHICYISNLGKLRADFPEWNITISLHDMIEQMVRAAHDRAAAGTAS